jgi:hypothetical protein
MVVASIMSRVEQAPERSRDANDDLVIEDAMGAKFWSDRMCRKWRSADYSQLAAGMVPASSECFATTRSGSRNTTGNLAISAPLPGSVPLVTVPGLVLVHILRYQ